MYLRLSTLYVREAVEQGQRRRVWLARSEGPAGHWEVVLGRNLYPKLGVPIRDDLLEPRRAGFLPSRVCHSTEGQGWVVLVVQ
jgi:hypothetical protein